jgi:hypothetical protein
MGKYFVRIIDETGLFVEDAFVDELSEFTIEAPCPNGFYRPRWNGETWAEGLTQAEIDAIKAAQSASPQPTLEELAENVNAAMVAVMELSLE